VTPNDEETTMKTRFILPVLTAAVLVVASCGSDDGGDAGDPTADGPAATDAPGATDAPVPTDGSTPAASAAPSADADSTVMVASDDALGEYLVDGNGRTLYLFEQDQGTTTACTGGCVDSWPPMVAESPVAGDGIDAALLGTADGIEANHVTYNGHLLYFFAGDITPGDTNGHGLPDWYAMTPAGDAIE
jgi:predicted lipoprotein with Yx(FWY)xxD motif